MLNEKSNGENLCCYKAVGNNVQSNDQLLTLVHTK